MSNEELTGKQQAKVQLPSAYVPLRTPSTGHGWFFLGKKYAKSSEFGNCEGFFATRDLFGLLLSLMAYFQSLSQQLFVRVWAVSAMGSRGVFLEPVEEKSAKTFRSKKHWRMI